MTKTKLIIFGIIIIAIFLIIVLFSLPKPSPRQNPSPTPTQTDTLNLNGISVKDITQGKSLNPNYGSIEFTDTSDFVINYFPEDEYFLISILGSPFEEKRRQAEKVFLSNLGIQKSEACLLNVEITTPFYANPEEAGPPYPLSFCEK